MRINFLKNLLIVEVVLLLAQFLVGMFVNLYESVPFQVDFGTFAYTAEGAGFGLHHYIMLFNLLFAALAIVFSIKMRNSLLSKLSLVGLVSLVISTGSGMALVFLEENDLYSMTMAASFIAALVVYIAAIFLAGKANT